jgi:hypothetical protein
MEVFHEFRFMFLFTFEFTIVVVKFRIQDLLALNESPNSLLYIVIKRQ